MLLTPKRAPADRKVIVCDLDGTLADLAHRRHLVERPHGNAANASAWRPDWDAFHRACVDDLPILTNIHVVSSLLESDPTRELWIVSGRSASVHEETVVWLNTHLDRYDRLIMRPVGDFSRDDLLKELWLLGGVLPKPDHILCVFDDRDRVVQMWRNHGLTCYQVAKGDF